MYPSFTFSIRILRFIYVVAYINKLTPFLLLSFIPLGKYMTVYLFLDRYKISCFPFSVIATKDMKTHIQIFV